MTKNWVFAFVSKVGRLVSGSTAASYVDLFFYVITKLKICVFSDRLFYVISNSNNRFKLNNIGIIN